MTLHDADLDAHLGDFNLALRVPKAGAARAASGSHHETRPDRAPVAGGVTVADGGGDPHAHGPAQGGRRRPPVAPRDRRPWQDRPHARRRRRPRRRRRRAPPRRRGLPGAHRRALLPQHRRAGDHVPGGDPRAGGGGAAEPGLHAGGVRVLPVRLGGAAPRDQRRGQRRRAGGRGQARPRPRRHHDPRRSRWPVPPRRPPGCPRKRRLSRTGKRQKRSVGRGSVPAHVRHDEPSQGRAADAAQPGGVGAEHPRGVPVRGDGRDGGDAAAVPRARAHVRAAVVPGVRRGRDAPGGRAVLGVDVLGRHAGGGGHVVHGRADHPPDHPGPARVQAGGGGLPGAPVRAQLQRVAGARDPGAAGVRVRGAGAGGVRDDGGVPHDDVEPAAGGRGTEAGVRGAAGGEDGAGGAGRAGEGGARGVARGGVRAGRERDGGVQGEPGGERGGVRVRVVPHGRHRRARRGGRVRAAGGADQGAGEPGRGEDLAHRGGLGAAVAPGRGAGGGVRRPRREVRRGDPLRGDPAGRGADGGGGGGGVLQEEPGRVQGAQEGVHRRRPAQDSHGQDPAAHRLAALLRAAGRRRRQGLEEDERSCFFFLFVCTTTTRWGCAPHCPGRETNNQSNCARDHSFAHSIREHTRDALTDHLFLSGGF